MKPFLIFDEIQETLLKVIFAQNIDRAIEIFANGYEVNRDVDTDYEQYFNIGDKYYSVEADTDFIVDSKYDIDKLTTLADKLLTKEHLYDYCGELGSVIEESVLKIYLNNCKKDFVSMVDKIVFLKEKNLFIQGLTEEQITFYYQKFAEVK